jgi:hypothetical protein
MRTTKAKLTYVTAFYVVFFGLLTLMELLDAPVELMVAVLTMVMVVMIGAMASLWEFPEEPPAMGAETGGVAQRLRSRPLSHPA